MKRILPFLISVILIFVSVVPASARSLISTTLEKVDLPDGYEYYFVQKSLYPYEKYNYSIVMSTGEIKPSSVEPFFNTVSDDSFYVVCFNSLADCESYLTNNENVEPLYTETVDTVRLTSNSSYAVYNNYPNDVSWYGQKSYNFTNIGIYTPSVTDILDDSLVEIIGILSVCLMCLVGFIALRKGISFLKGLISNV